MLFSTLSHPRTRLPASACALLAVLFIGARAAHADDFKPQLPPEMQGAGITQKLGSKAAIDARFVDETGAPVTIKSYLKQGRPVILTLNYFRCPMLCNLTLNGMVHGLNELEWSAGEEFVILTVSFNPDEGTELADVKKRAYLTQYARESAAEGWHFLTGSKDQIEALCSSVGFGYKLQPDGEYAHSSTIIFLTPDGVVSRYMNDVQFAPSDLRLALTEASQGGIGSWYDHILLMCLHYDPDRNSYVASAWKIMRLGGVVTIAVMAMGLLFLWRGSWGAGATRFREQSTMNHEPPSDGHA